MRLELDHLVLDYTLELLGQEELMRKINLDPDKLRERILCLAELQLFHAVAIESKDNAKVRRLVSIIKPLAALRLRENDLAERRAMMAKREAEKERAAKEEEQLKADREFIEDEDRPPAPRNPTFPERGPIKYDLREEDARIHAKWAAIEAAEKAEKEAAQKLEEEAAATTSLPS